MCNKRNSTGRGPATARSACVGAEGGGRGFVAILLAPNHTAARGRRSGGSTSPRSCRMARLSSSAPAETAAHTLTRDALCSCLHRAMAIRSAATSAAPSVHGSMHGTSASSMRAAIPRAASARQRGPLQPSLSALGTGARARLFLRLANARCGLRRAVASGVGSPRGPNRRRMPSASVHSRLLFFGPPSSPRGPVPSSFCAGGAAAADDGTRDDVRLCRSSV